MSDFVSFKVTVELATPVILGKSTFWTLDGVCYGILADMREKGIVDLDPTSSIPLKNEDGLFLASRALFENEIRVDMVKIGGIRPVKDMDRASEFLLAPRKRLAKVITHRGPHRSNMSRCTEITSRYVSWIGIGDPESISALLLNAGSIGALRKEGYGKIADVFVDVDDSYDPIIHDGKLMRPVPEDHALSDRIATTTPKFEDTWRPPYFDATARAICYIPT